jgi:hypothetical protein
VISRPPSFGKIISSGPPALRRIRPELFLSLLPLSVTIQGWLDLLHQELGINRLCSIHFYSLVASFLIANTKIWAKGTSFVVQSLLPVIPLKTLELGEGRIDDS